MKRHSQSGQVLLITLLVLSIAVTVALALIARTTTDVSISGQVEDSARAFNAAEAGIEQSLRSGLGTDTAQVLSNGSQYQVSVANIGGATGVYQFPQKALRGVVQTLWLTNHNADGTINDSWSVPAGSDTPYAATTIDVCWSKETVAPALEISIWKDTDQVYRRTYDPEATRRADNFFSSVTATTGTNCGSANMYRQHITFTSDFNAGIRTTTTMRLMRIRPIYSDATIAIDTGANHLPQQGKRIESVGTSGAGVTRRIVVYQQYRAPLSLFDNVLYSQTDLAQ